MLPESAWAADEVPAPVKASKATRAARNPGENRMVESPWNRGLGKSSTPGGLGTMKPRPARGAIRPGGQPGEQKHERCDEQDDVHFFPPSKQRSANLQTGRRVPRPAASSTNPSPSRALKRPLRNSSKR